MPLQRDIFADGEGAEWLNRNMHDLGKRDPVMDAMEVWKLQPQSILEVGCSNGWRVMRLIERYGCKVKGIDPAVPKMPDGSQLNNLRPGHAAALFHYGVAEFDTLIYGFCLYLCDPSDYTAIVKEGDRVLAEGGHIIIHDFDVEDERPWRTPYKHKDGLFSYHVNFAALWTAFPQYTEIGDSPVRGVESVRILRKNTATAFVDRPNP
jgi:ubiquinone/menaquinone biosynthesis C-methylase UbiE